MSLTYVTASGVYDKLDPPVRWIGFDVHPFLREACQFVEDLTGRVWASGDFLAMRAAEYMAAALLADANYGTSETGRRMRVECELLVNVLSPKWSKK